MSESEVTEEELLSHLDDLYNTLNYYAFLRYLLLLLSLVCLGYSAISSVENSYYLALTTLIFQFISWLFLVKVNKIDYQTHELHKISLLKKSYNNYFPSPLDLSHLMANSTVLKTDPILKFYLNCEERIITICQKIKTKLFSADDVKNKEGFLLKDTSTPEKKLLSMIQQNSYWNHHLYRSAFVIYSIPLLTALAIAIFSLLYLIPSGGINLSILLIVFVFLSFSIIYEMLDKLVTYYESSKVMLEVDNEIERIFEKDEINVLDTFHKYLTVKERTSSIPYPIYMLSRNKLNKAWEARVAAWRNSHET